MSTYIEEVSKSIEIAKEFIKRASLVVQEQDNAELLNKRAKESGDKTSYCYHRVSNVHTAALRRQSMELTRQLAVIRKPLI